MAFLDDLADFFVDEVTVARQTFDAYGAPTAGASVTIAAKISQKIARVKNQNGEEVVSQLFATLLGAPLLDGTPIKTTDKFTLPTRFDPRELSAVSVQYVTDENGPLFVRAYF